MDVADLPRTQPDEVEAAAPAAVTRSELRRPAAPASPARSKRILFAGLTAGQLGFGFVGILALLWAVWATHKIIAVDHRRIVAVRLSALVGDFVNAEARSGDDPRNLSARTQAYMGALDLLLKKRAATGETVIVAEAVVGESVPDITSQIADQLAQVVRLPRALPLPAPAAPVAGSAPQGNLSFNPQLQGGAAAPAQFAPPALSAPPSGAGVQVAPDGSDPFAGGAPTVGN